MAEAPPPPRPLPDKIRDWLEDHPFELRVAGTFHAAGYNVEQSFYYRENQEAEPRELDILAQAARSFEHAAVQVLLTITTVIECKSNPKNKRPWVVFTAPSKLVATYGVHDVSLFSNIVTSVLSEPAADEARAELKLLQLGERVGYGIASPGVEKHDKGNDDLAYAAVTKLASAAYAMHAPSKDSNSGYCPMVVPVLAVATPLFECWLNSDGAIELEERKELRLLWRRPTVQQSRRPFLIHVVHESAMAEFAAKGQRLLELFVENLKDPFATAVAVAKVKASEQTG
jgi:hypothetical protein